MTTVTPHSRTPFSAALAATLPFLLCVWPPAVTPALTQGREPVSTDSTALMGQVAARETHVPIRGAQVTIQGGSFTTSTDSSGLFAFTGLRAGAFVIEIRAIGYAQGSWRVPLAAGQVLRFRFEMEPLAVELPEVVVKGRPSPAARRFADFDRRRQGGLGAFITQEDIERANPSSLIDILVSVRGVRQVCLTNDCVAKMVRSPAGCYPQYYLDGQESTAYFARHTPPLDVKGVEIYRGSSETPAEFEGSNSGCGVIVIWTKSAP